MTSSLKQLMQAGDISYLSYYFGEFIAEQSTSDMDDLVTLSAALVSEKNQQGDVCILLDDYVNQPLFSTQLTDLKPMQRVTSVLSWQQQLLDSPCVGRPGECAPLTLEDNRLYLNRFWLYESRVAESIMARLNQSVDIDQERFLPSLRALFPGVDRASDSAGQMIAVAIAARHRFSVISGGPGTGKTTTVVKLLMLLLSQEPQMRIQLAAPTGKAAMRLVDSIQTQVGYLSDDNMRDGGIPTEASTIHRLLGYGSQRFHYDRDHPLAVDCIVVDEASMIDLTLMVHLLDALASHTRIILLGDRDQLASVAAGNVLGDITGHGLSIGYTQAQDEFIDSIFIDTTAGDIGIDQSAPVQLSLECTANQPIANAIALLTHSYRFKSDSGIGQLAQLINHGSGQQAVDLLSAGGEQLYWHQDIEKSLAGATLDWILSQYKAVVHAASVDLALQAFETIRTLCAIRSGPFGVTEINRLITTKLSERRWISGNLDQNDHYRGKPILITQNDYELGLFNGDVGMIWPDDSGILRAYFRSGDSSLREIHVQNLTEHVTAWAMTVHKSQGSEFDNVLLILPQVESALALSRELLYTGATRARQQLYIHASAASILSSCHTLTQRHSGLARKLGWQNN